jgi:hypothetical protein
MSSVLMPMSECQPLLVKEYLLRQEIHPEIIEWKYFDERFNGNRERGFAWIQENKISGFLGLIPFRAQKAGHGAECAWSCDWSVDNSISAGGMGIMLLKRARGAYDGIFNLGGNVNTRRIFPRLADRTILDAGISLVLPLRLGSVLSRLPPGILRAALARGKFLQDVPLRWIRSGADRRIQIERGISRQIESVFERGGAEWAPFYDYEYVDWQLGRCPSIACWSCYLRSHSAPQFAAIIWRPIAAPSFWRMALCGTPDREHEAELLLRTIIRFVYEQRGMAISAVASRLDRGLLNLLVARGFLRRRARLPFYAMKGRDANLPGDEFATLSFLDADLAYRFSPQAPDSSPK